MRLAMKCAGRCSNARRSDEIRRRSRGTPVREDDLGPKPARRQTSALSRRMSAADERRSSRPTPSAMVMATSSDRFFRDMVGSMRNGVIAIQRDGHIAVMNDVACHALHVPVRATNIGGHYADVLHGAPEV